jgi:hypothetical protein
MTGIIVYIHTSHLITEEPLISITIHQISAKITTKTLEKDVLLSVNCHIPLLKDSIILTSIRQIIAKNILRRERPAKRGNSVLLFTIHLK